MQQCSSETSAFEGSNYFAVIFTKKGGGGEGVSRRGVPNILYIKYIKLCHLPKLRNIVEVMIR